MANRLTLNDAKAYPANYIYIWASEKFLSQIDYKHAVIIRTKQLNEMKLVRSMAVIDGDEKLYDSYVQQIRKAFIDKYGMTPAAALIELANGEEVADKKWSEGLYGIGKAIIQRNNFATNTNVTVDPDTGVISYNGKAQTCTPVYGKNGVVSNQNATIDGTTYSSIYDKSSGKYYAYQVCPQSGDGMKYNANGEQLKIGTLTNSMWQDIEGIMGEVWGWIEKIVDFFMSHFNFSSSSSSTTEPAPQITTENSVPSQTKDGFTYNSKTSVGILLIATATAALLFARRRKKD